MKGQTTNDLIMKTMIQTLSAIFLSGILMPAMADGLEDLKKRFQERAQVLSKLRADGKLGETDAGYVEPVKGANLSDNETSLMQAENRDRRTGYTLIANKRGISATKVGQLSGIKKIQSARPGEWIKQGGAWKRKE